MPLPDEAFTFSREIEFKPPEGWEQSTTIYAYSAEFYASANAINVEFIQSNGEDRKMLDAYFYPEDLERLGILFQYLGQTAREKRDNPGA